MEYKHSFEIKNIDDSGVIEGYGAVFGNVDDGGDIIEKGAFSGSLEKKSRTVKMFLNHDSNRLVGRWTDMFEDDYGLYVRGQINLETVAGRESYSLAKQKALDGLSIGYRVIEQAKQGVNRLLKELDLFEVSLTPIPMNALATITAVKNTDYVEVARVIEDLKAGGQLSIREFETLFKGLGLSNSQAEKATKANIKKHDSGDKLTQFLKALQA